MVWNDAVGCTFYSAKHRILSTHCCKGCWKDRVESLWWQEPFRAGERKCWEICIENVCLKTYVKNVRKREWNHDLNNCVFVWCVTLSWSCEWAEQSHCFSSLKGEISYLPGVLTSQRCRGLNKVNCLEKGLENDVCSTNTWCCAWTIVIGLD